MRLLTITRRYARNPNHKLTILRKTAYPKEKIKKKNILAAVGFELGYRHSQT